MSITFKAEPEVPAGAPVYAPSATVEEFIYAVAGGPATEFRLLMLMSSKGEGKTSGAIYALLALAERVRRDGKGVLLPIRVAVVRDTWVHLQKTTIATLEKQQRLGLSVVWREGKHEAVIPGQLHFFFFGMDNRDDVDNLQGFECAVMWLEEVAPGADLTQGIPAETLGIGRTAIRQEGLPKRIILTFNPPDEDHWVLKVEEHLAQLGLKDLVVHRFVIPPGERSTHFRAMAKRAARGGNFVLARQWEEAAEEFDTYREQNIAFLESIGRHDLVARLGRGEIGGVQIGESVVSTFSYKLHVTEPGEKLVCLPGSQMWRSWDGGLLPSTVFIEETPSGNVNVHGSRVSINKAMAQHILDEVLPFQEKSGLRPRRPGEDYRRQRGWDYRDCGDPSLFESDKVQDAEYSAGLTIQQMFRTTIEVPPTNDWPPRRDAGLVAFQRKGQGQRMLIRIQREENQILIQGLNGRFRYPVDMATGRINPAIKAAKRVSGIFAQPTDNLLYFLVLKFPAHDWLRREPGPGSPKPPLPEPRDWLGV